MSTPEPVTAADILMGLRAEDAIRQAQQPVEPEIRATRFTVSALPETDINYRHAAIHIEYEGRTGTGGELWSVQNIGAYLWPDGSWRVHEFHAWPNYQRARAAAIAAIDTTPSAIASDALARRKEQPR